jgi:ubiquinone/menaquinone biosynthesis C-methylase UbiE
MPFEDDAFDVVCAFQMLEHLPFDDSCRAFGEMARVASRAVVISLPDAATRWPMSIYLPKIGVVRFSIPRPRLRTPVHQFDGEHYWEIGKAGYPLAYVTQALTESAPVSLSQSFRVPEFPYHRFFIFRSL